MAEEVKVAWGEYTNPSKTYTRTEKVLGEDGKWHDEEVEAFGAPEPGYRHPVTHQIIFESDSDEVVEAKGTPHLNGTEGVEVEFSVISKEGGPQLSDPGSEKKVEE